MTTVNIYLNFDGTCEEAFTFYKSVFGGEFPYVGRFKDMPPQEGMPPLPEGAADKIMHISLPLSKETVLMGSDSVSGFGPELKSGNNFAITASPDSREEADRIFNALSEDGQVTMAMNQTFWGDYFGMLTDKFGINWMISFAQEQQ